jgi:hypothetical protein
MIPISRSREDEPGFIEQVQCIVAGCINQYKPAEVYVIRIRDWFDYKWCYFSGKALGALAVSKFRDLTLPPFVPNRVIAQEHYVRVEADSDVFQLSNAPPLHIRQRSGENFKRFIRRTTNHGTLFWFSSGSMATGRGSLMVYNVSPDIKFGWHVTFLKKVQWQIEKVTFTSKAMVEALRRLGANKHAVSARPVAPELADPVPQERASQPRGNSRKK